MCRVVGLEVLIQDLRDDLHAQGLEFIPWEDSFLEERPALLAVVWAPSAGTPAQAATRDAGVPDELRLLALRYIQKALAGLAEGSAAAFQSFDPVHNRAVALVYDKAGP